MLKDIKKRLRNFLRKLRRKPEVERFYRDQIRFRKRYPTYEIGVGSYGMPVVQASTGSTGSVAIRFQPICRKQAITKISVALVAT